MSRPPRPRLRFALRAAAFVATCLVAASSGATEPEAAAAEAPAAVWRGALADCLVASAGEAPEAAVDACGRVLADPGAAAGARREARRLRGAAWLELGALADARADLEAALAQAPHDPATLALLGALRLAAQDADGAARAFGAALDGDGLDPASRANLLEMRGVARFAATDRLGALADFAAAHRLDPGRFPSGGPARLAVADGAARLEGGDAAAALDRAEAALALAPGDAHALGLRAAALAALGRADAAEAGFLEAMGAEAGYGRALERALALRGHDPGAVDGRVTGRTAAALRACLAAACRLLEDPRFRSF